MKYFTKIHLFLILTFLLYGNYGCKKLSPSDFNKLAGGEWAPDLAIPVAHSVFDIYDVLAHIDSSDLIVVNPTTGFIALNYKTTTTSIAGSDYIKVNDFSDVATVSLTELGTPPVPSFTGQLNFDNSETIDFSLEEGDVKLKEFKFDEGELNLSANSSFQHSITLTISIPALKKNGISFTKTIQLAAASGSNSTSITNEDLKGYLLDLTTVSGTDNAFEIDYSVQLQGTGNTINATDKIDLTFNFGSIKMDYAKGYLGQRVDDIFQDSVLLKIFENSQAGYFEMKDATVRFTIQNSFGIPLKLKLNQLQTINTENGVISNLLGYPQNIDIQSPTILGDSAQTEFVLDKSNTTNINQIITPTPKYFSFNANLLTNPNGYSGMNNFISKNSKLSIRTEVELPLYGLAHSFVLKDTVDFQPPTEANMIKSVMFRLIVNNGFPIDAFSKLKFVDENYQTKFEISDLNDPIVKSAITNTNGDVVSNTKKITDLKLNEQQIALLDKVKYIIIVAELQTKDAKNGKYVKFYDFYKLALKLSVEFEGKLNF